MDMGIQKIIAAISDRDRTPEEVSKISGMNLTATEVTLETLVEDGQVAEVTAPGGRVTYALVRKASR